MHNKTQIPSLCVSKCRYLCMRAAWLHSWLYTHSEPSHRSRCSAISSPVARYVSMRPSVTGRECQLDVLVTKLSILSDGQIRLVEMGTGPCKRKPDVPQIHTNMQINIKINITLANEPSITGQFLSSSALARQHQSATPSNGVIEHRPLIPLTPLL